MASAELNQVAVDIDVDGKVARLRATGSIVTFDGFLKLYQEDRDDKTAAGDDETPGDRRLPKLAEGDAVTRRGVLPEQPFTQPPPRYSAARLVKKREEIRSEERLVGKECVRKCRSRGAPYHSKHN